MLSEYAKAGVDVKKISPFKREMGGVAKLTRHLPGRRNVVVVDTIVRPHGGIFYYSGWKRHFWCKTQEGPGNKPAISEIMYENFPSGPSYADVTGYDTAMMAVNDCVAQAGLPVAYTNEVVANASEWFADENRAAGYAQGVFDACHDAGMALVGGESAVDRYLVGPPPPVKHGVVASGCATGIIAPHHNLITGRALTSGDEIVGIASTGPHANGSTLIIERVMGNKARGIKGLSNGFDTKLPSGQTIGSACLVRTRCYVALVEALLARGVDIHAVMPGTGGGVAKLALAGKDDRPLRYKLHSWPRLSEIFQFFLHELNLSLFDCLTTFNWGIGYYLIVPRHEVERTIHIAAKAGYEAFHIGRVEGGERGVSFPGPSGEIPLPPPD